MKLLENKDYTLVAEDYVLVPGKNGITHNVPTIYRVYKQQYYMSGDKSFKQQVGKAYTQYWRARKLFDTCTE